MVTLGSILTQFIFRLSFGVAVASGVTPSRVVGARFYQLHLWVLMGLNTLAALAAWSGSEQPGVAQRFVAGLAAVVVLVSFVGSAIWMCEARRAGKFAIVLVALLSLVAAALATPLPEATTARGVMLMLADLISGGLVLGIALSAMLLGHWYLNTPTMQLLPLKRLVLMMACAVLVRTLLCAIGLGVHLQSQGPLAAGLWAFIALRWLCGLLGTLALAWMAWLTLKVPNTQSATGILYAGVICAFIGELTSKLLSVGLLYPL